MHQLLHSPCNVEFMYMYKKPMTHNIREARLLTQMARDNKVVSQMGNQGGSNPLLGMVQNWIDSDQTW